MDGTGGPLNSEVHFWRRFLVGWHALAAATVTLSGVLVATDTGLPPPRRLFGVGVLAVLAGWYGVFGVRALHREDERAGQIYLGGTAVALGALVAVTTTGAFLLFALNPQLFAMVRHWRYRIAFIVLYATEVAAGILWHTGVSWRSIGRVGVLVVFPLFLALLLGAFITGIIAQSRQRAQLIEELTETRTALARERHGAGVLAERERLAAEIHDTLAQGFASVVLLVQAARAALERDPAAVDHRLDLVERTARDNLEEARALVAALSPPDLADGSLAEALRRVAARHYRDTGVPVEVSVVGAPVGGAPEVDVVLLRAAQEALANAYKHASAGTVHIELSTQDNLVALAVTDDGCGFDVAGVTEGYGLRGLRTRAVASGGTCAVSSALGDGTTIRVELPV